MLINRLAAFFNNLVTKRKAPHGARLRFRRRNHMKDSNRMFDLKHYWDSEQWRVALIVSTGSKWMKVLVVEVGKLKIVRRPLADLSYMKSIPPNQRKAKASLRRLARKRGTPRSVRTFLGDLL